MTDRRIDPPPSRDAAPRNMSGFLEVCVDSVAGARAAIAGGADQLELCGALALGGLTPSSGLARAVIAVARPAGVPVRAMVRPRAGDFDYDAGELAVAVAEAQALLADGVDGLVFGAVRGDAVHAQVLAEWCAAVRAAPGGEAAGLTFHRAIDVVADPLPAIETILCFGFDQILSSGGATSALAGADTLAAMARAAAGRCRIVAAAGITPATVDALIAHGVAPAIHASARTPSGQAEPVADRFGFGHAPPPADAATVFALRRGIDRHACA